MFFLRETRALGSWSVSELKIVIGLFVSSSFVRSRSHSYRSSLEMNQFSNMGFSQQQVYRREKNAPAPFQNELEYRTCVKSYFLRE